MSRNLLCAAVVFLLLGSALPCFSQSFGGTTLSGTEPFYGKPPYHYENSEYYFISFRTDPAVIRALVPEPLVPLSAGDIQIFFTRQKVTDPVRLSYDEVYLMIPVSFENAFGGYIPVLYLDRAEAIIPGRAIWGFNKTGADIRFEKSDRHVDVTVAQMDTVIIRASFTLGEPMAHPQQSGIGSIINLKYVPSVIRDAPPEVLQLTYAKLTGNRSGQMRPGRATLEFSGSRLNPLDQIPVLEIKSAGFTENSYTLEYGEVLFDYLDP